MEHLNPTTLLQAAGQELAPDRQREVDEHIESCERCRAAYQELIALQDQLGEWKIDASHYDVQQRVEKALHDLPTRRSTWIQAIQIGRVAAMVALGIGLGYGAGRLAGREQRDPTPVSPSTTAHQALTALGFEAVESTSATGLFTTFLPQNEPAEDSEDTP